MVADERLVLAQDEHAHDVEADASLGDVEVGSQVSGCHAFERLAVELLGGEVTAAIGDLGSDED